MAKQKVIPSASNYVQNIAASNVPAQWANYWPTTAGTASPNLMWQGTTSGATYSAASSVLKAS